MLRRISEDEEQPDASVCHRGPANQETVHRAGCGVDVYLYRKSFGSCGLFVNITKQYACKCRLAARPGRSKQTSGSGRFEEVYWSDW